MREHLINPSLSPDSPLYKALRKQSLALNLQWRLTHEIADHQREITSLESRLAQLEPGLTAVEAEIEALSNATQVVVEPDPLPEVISAPVVSEAA